MNCSLQPEQYTLCYSFKWCPRREISFGHKLSVHRSIQCYSTKQYVQITLSNFSTIFSIDIRQETEYL